MAIKTILHPDYWVEIPAGKFITGLPEDQYQLIKQRIEQNVKSTFHKELLDTVNRHRYELSIELQRFFMARFPLISLQSMVDDTPATNLTGFLDIPPNHRTAAEISHEDPGRFYKKFGGRLPTVLEWEKAARGPTGRLYPWGNEWDGQAGFFYYGQGQAVQPVDACPRGMSPYGVWAMAGGLPELVLNSVHNTLTRMGCHARRSSEKMAWFDHLLIFNKGGRWVSFRPVLDAWPEQTFTGFQAGLTIPNAEALQKMGPLADTLLTQYPWSTLETRVLDALEPAIVALREARKAEAQQLAARLLGDQKTQLEATWLLLAAATENIPKQREYVKRAMALNPDSEVGWKLGKLLQDPARMRW